VPHARGKAKKNRHRSAASPDANRVSTPTAILGIPPKAIADFERKAVSIPDDSGSPAGGRDPALLHGGLRLGRGLLCSRQVLDARNVVARENLE
jgi:hypothetical protein